MAIRETDLDKLVFGMRRYITDPVAFVRDVLLVEPDDWQIEALNALVKRGRLAIRAGHGTGKSAFESWSILWFLFTRPFPKVVCTAPSKQQLFDVLWAELAKWMQNAPVLQTYFEWQKTRVVMVQEPERWWASARTATKPENFAGIHEEHVLIVCDEASGIRDKIFEVAEGALTTPDAKLILCGNPTQLSGEFYQAFHNRRHLYHAMKVSCIDSPRVTREYIDNLKQKYGEHSQVYKVRVLGEFPDAEPDVFIPLPLVEKAAMRDVCEYYEEHDDKGRVIKREPLVEGQPIQLGVDPARFGGDEIVIYPRVGAYVFEPHVFHSIPTTELSGRIIQIGREMMERWRRPDITVVIDVGAMGAGVFDEVADVVGSHLFPGEWNLVPFNFGGQGDSESDDAATVAYKNARDRLPELHIPNDERTIGQLTTRKYKVSWKNGKFKLESKDDYKKRYPEEGSPDRADAFVLCLYDGGVDAVHTVQTVRAKPATAGMRRKKF
ncbi:terminase B [Alicyclobacillus sp. ALC3]|uniref:terminase B n=1 Tax=Alicyclobacillus sp. ALC3 TaxID=2796143 RepID=UPI0023783E7B|nr:terminase B [Alicyclobacillus sp. ALC3]WDL96395.1 DEAD/DEAH box helicase family protein [Alicyclobacillus sp. ALC3]